MTDLRIILRRSTGPYAGIPEICGTIGPDDIAVQGQLPAKLHIKDERDGAVVDLLLQRVEKTYALYSEDEPVDTTVVVQDCSNQKGWDHAAE
jgi:hypothetical protein